MSILTQYIGLSATAAANNTLAASNTGIKDPERELKSELDGLKKEFLNQTDFLVWGQRNMEALNRAVARRCIPVKLQIITQPQVNTTNNLFN